MKSPFQFKQYGESGRWVSSVFPNQAELVDELANLADTNGLLVLERRDHVQVRVFDSRDRVTWQRCPPVYSEVP